MKKRIFSIDCGNNEILCHVLHQILNQFIDTAFLPNASDCAQATRASLLALNQQIKENKGAFHINTRQRPLLKTAITGYFSEVDVGNTIQQQALLQLIAKRKKSNLIH